MERWVQGSFTDFWICTYNRCLNINLVLMGSTRPCSLCKTNLEQSVYLAFASIFPFLSSICLFRLYLIHSAPSQFNSQDIPDRILSKATHSSSLKFNLESNSVRHPAGCIMSCMPSFMDPVRVMLLEMLNPLSSCLLVFSML